MLSVTIEVSVCVLDLQTGVNRTGNDRIILTLENSLIAVLENAGQAGKALAAHMSAKAVTNLQPLIGKK